MADVALPVTGRLIADVRLDIEMDDLISGMISGSVLITAASTRIMLFLQT